MGRYDNADEVTQGGDRLKFSDHLGALVCIRPLEVTSKEFDNKKDDDDEDAKPEKKTVLTVICDIDLIEGGYMPKSKKAAPARFKGVWVMGAVLAKSLEGKVGKEVLGRVEEGTPGNYGNAPIILAAYTEEDEALADAFYEEYGDGAVPEEPTGKAKKDKGKVASPAKGKAKKPTPEQEAKIREILGE